MTEAIQDSITLQLRADRIVTNDTIKVTVNVTALSANEQSDEALRSDIKTALNGLIADTKWQFGGAHRTMDASGYERVDLTAHTRVNEKENVKLHERAESASRQGLQLRIAQIDLTVPGPKLEAAEKELRGDLLKKAKEEIDMVKEITGREYRLSSVVYQNHGDPVMRKGGAMTSNITAYAMAASAPGGGDDDGALTNSQKVSLSATVELAVVAWAPTTTALKPPPAL